MLTNSLWHNSGLIATKVAIFELSTQKDFFGQSASQKNISCVTDHESITLSSRSVLDFKLLVLKFLRLMRY